MQDAMLRQVAASTAGTGPGLTPEHCCWLQVGDWTEASTAVRHDRYDVIHIYDVICMMYVVLRTTHDV